ncbi:MAG: DUF2480 family protein [Ginsengibacter sp.]
MEEVIINKVAQSALTTIDLEKFYPQGDVKLFDLKDYLFMELILKEKDFREALKNMDFSGYQGKNAGITCSADAVIPMWAYMLAASYLEPYAKEIVFGNETTVNEVLFLKNLWTLDPAEFAGQRVVVKGCGEKKIPETAYVEITKILRPVAKSIMYGEPCSTVPIYKQAKTSIGGV